MTSSNKFYWQGKTYYKDELISYLQNCSQEEREDWEMDIFLFALDWLNENYHSFLVKTSGSTGKPKMISLSREQMKLSASATRDFLELKKGDRALLALPASFIAGKMMIVRALEYKLDLYYYPPQVSVVENIENEFDFAAFIPLQLQYAFDHQLEYKLSDIRKMIIGGASLSSRYLAAVSNLPGKVFATYGMTETITHIAMRDLKNHNEFFNALPGIRFSVSEQKCLQIKSDRLPESIIQTNDVVDLISDNQFILKGRLDSVINSGGLKIYPEQLEESIEKILHREVFIGFLNDEYLGQKLVMVLEKKQNELNKQEIFPLLINKIEKNKIPKQLLFISSFLRTENQKINRKAMQNWIQSQSIN